MTGLDTDFAGFDPGTTSGVDAPESASSSADASTGFDFSGDLTSVNDPFSYYDPATKAYSPGYPSSTFDRPAYGDSSTAYRQAIDALSRMGYGNMEGANPNNPTQTVDQMIAANNINNLLGYAPPIIGALTGFGPQISAVQALQRLSSGQTTPGQVLTGLAAGLIGAKTGIPSGILEGIFTNNPGQVAGAGAQAGLGALVNSLTNNPFARVMSDVTLGSALNKNVSNAVGGSSKQDGGLPAMLDSGLGSLSKLFSGTGAPSQGSATKNDISSDAGSSDSAYAVTSAIEDAAQKYTSPTLRREAVAGRYGPVMQHTYGA